MKISFFVFGLLFFNSAFAQDLESNLVQSRYPGIAGMPASFLMVDGSTSQLVQAENYEGFLKKSIGVAGKPENVVSLSGQQITIYPYVVAPDDEYSAYMKQHAGYKGKPANHVSIDGRETILLSTKEVSTNISFYPGLEGKPANHVMMGGVETVIVKKEEYRAFISKHKGIAGMPSNYLKINGKTVIVLADHNGGMSVNKNMAQGTDPKVSGAHSKNAANLPIGNNLTSQKNSVDSSSAAVIPLPNGSNAIKP